MFVGSANGSEEEPMPWKVPQVFNMHEKLLALSEANEEQVAQGIQPYL